MSQKISFKNETGYVFDFSVRWQSSDGKWNTTESCGGYPATQSRTLSLDEIGVPADAVAVTPYGHTVSQLSGQGTPPVTFASNDHIAIYEATVTPEKELKITLIE
ncbi:hypothetical protein [Cupriavidus sp. UYPR2.512]|uniref:hypothetical protein n=1 Tax=Cupriavidus sp. UYPR2.512 TaxID=1080187 RepID=UPI000362AF54|nr:hypothetical protein [Cupriavidus sp. UYPR2.512]UIF87965.1 hypothetical protein KAF44_21985 [Cupriavidus necator]